MKRFKLFLEALGIDDITKLHPSTEFSSIAKMIGPHGEKLHKVKKLTNDQEYNLGSYSGASHYNINMHHRGLPKPDGTPINHESAKRQSKFIDAAIKKHKTEDDATVWRGINHDAVKDLKEGEHFHDKGYVSTSLNPLISGTFGGSHHDPEKGYQKHFMKIHLPKGSTAMYLNSYPNIGAIRGEHEVLLPRNSKFRYDKQETKDVSNGLYKSEQVIHHVTHIPEDSNEKV